MQNFIVLGYVPGTQIQLNFNFWLWASIAVCSVWMLVLLARHRRAFYLLFLGLYVRRAVRAKELTFTPAFE